MEKQKTALQQLIDWIEENTAYNNDTKAIRDKAKSLLPTEREHINKAWESADNFDGYISADDYFNDNFQE